METAVRTGLGHEPGAQAVPAETLDGLGIESRREHPPPDHRVHPGTGERCGGEPSAAANGPEQRGTVIDLRRA